MDNGSAAEVLRACNADIEKLKIELEELLDSTTPLIPKNDTDREAQPTLGFQRVVQRAIFHAQTQNKEAVNGAGVLVAVFSEQESHAVYLLKQQGISRVDVVNYIAHGTTKDGSEHESPESAEGEGGAVDLSLIHI